MEDYNDLKISFPKTLLLQTCFNNIEKCAYYNKWKIVHTIYLYSTITVASYNIIEVRAITVMIADIEQVSSMNASHPNLGSR